MSRLREFASISALILLLAVAEIILQQPAQLPARPAPQLPRAAPVAKVVQSVLPPIVVPDSHLPPDAVARAALPPRRLSVSNQMTGEEFQVATRLAARVPTQLAPYFDVFIYVSKAASGPWGQRLFLFHKDSDGSLAYEEKLTVSTGREHSEQYFTATPAGLFQLDASRFMRMAYSNKWNDAQMPFAMFLNYAYRTQMTGVALHAAIGARELADLGSRASGGCVRLPLDKAEILFNRFKSQERGTVPVFAFDEGRGTTNVDGRIVRDTAGRPYTVNGVRVLVLIENYAGEVATAQL